MTYCVSIADFGNSKVVMLEKSTTSVVPSLYLRPTSVPWNMCLVMFHGCLAAISVVLERAEILISILAILGYESCRKNHTFLDEFSDDLIVVETLFIALFLFIF